MKTNSTKTLKCRYGSTLPRASGNHSTINFVTPGEGNGDTIATADVSREESHLAPQTGIRAFKRSAENDESTNDCKKPRGLPYKKPFAGFGTKAGGSDSGKGGGKNKYGAKGKGKSQAGGKPGKGGSQAGGKGGSGSKGSASGYPRVSKQSTLNSFGQVRK
jgi:hypothetical protein